MAVRAPNPSKIRRVRRVTNKPSRPYEALLLPERPPMRTPRGTGLHWQFVSKGWRVSLDSRLMVEHAGNAVAAHIYRHLSQGKYPNTGAPYPPVGAGSMPPRYVNTGRFVAAIARSTVRGRPDGFSTTRIEMKAKARYGTGGRDTGGRSKGGKHKGKSYGYQGMLARDGQKWGTWPFWMESGGLTQAAMDVAFAQYVDAALRGFTKDADRRRKVARRLVVSGY